MLSTTYYNLHTSLEAIHPVLYVYKYHYPCVTVVYITSTYIYTTIVGGFLSVLQKLSSRRAWVSQARTPDFVLILTVSPLPRMAHRPRADDRPVFPLSRCLLIPCTFMTDGVHDSLGRNSDTLFRRQVFVATSFLRINPEEKPLKWAWSWPCSSQSTEYSAC